MGFYGDKVTYFCNKKSPKEESKHVCLAVMSLDSALKKVVLLFN